jgi:hypothetical protein
MVAVVVRSSAARTNCDYIDNNDGGGGGGNDDDDDTYYYNFVSLFENLKI